LGLSRRKATMEVFSHGARDVASGAPAEPIRACSALSAAVDLRVDAFGGFGLQIVV
jgi:hypothetical protein